MSNFLVCGPSLSAGFGLSQWDLENNFWLKYLVNSVFRDITIDNFSETGCDNQAIFKNAYTHIRSGKYRYALVSLAMIPRTNIHYGLELYNTVGPYVVFGNGHYKDINLHSNQTVSTRFQKNNTFNMRYYNYHWDIVDLLFNTTVLQDIAQQNNCKVCFVNYNLPWMEYQYFKRKEWKMPSDLDPFTQEVLEVDYRSDEEIRLLYNKIHNDYDFVGGVSSLNWINLYNPMIKHKVDQIYESESHPGPLSQKLLADILVPGFTKLFNS